MQTNVIKKFLSAAGQRNAKNQEWLCIVGFQFVSMRIVTLRYWSIIVSSFRPLRSLGFSPAYVGADEAEE